jgi:pimeloyl-ACP methyl ester carboxylesterase
MKRYSLILICVLVAALSLPVVSSAQGLEPVDISMFPPPTGPYQVGRITQNWVDTARDETLTEDTADKRELVVRIWYPGEVETGATPALYVEDLSGPAAAEVMSIFQMDSSDPFVQSLINLTSHAYADVPVSDGQSAYSVLIMSHGSGASPEDYTLQAIELASHGYIVVGIFHTYYSAAVVFPDGHVAQGVEFSMDIRQQAEATCAQDIVFALDQMENANASDPDGMFTGRLDLERIGVFGHSMGGAAAVLAGSMDDRIKAVVNEDADIDPTSYPAVEQPFMFFSAGTPYFPSAGPNYTVLVNDFEHGSFADWPVFIPGIGSIEGQRQVEIVRAYVLAFFDKYLKGEDSGLLDGPSEAYPEVEISAKNIE